MRRSPAHPGDVLGSLKLVLYPHSYAGLHKPSLITASWAHRVPTSKQDMISGLHIPHYSHRPLYLLESPWVWMILISLVTCLPTILRGSHTRPIPALWVDLSSFSLRRMFKFSMSSVLISSTSLADRLQTQGCHT